jgi:hypothetical protein
MSNRMFRVSSVFCAPDVTLYFTSITELACTSSA